MKRDIKDQLRSIGFAYCDVNGYRLTVKQSTGMTGKGIVTVRNRETREIVAEKKTRSPSSVMEAKIDQYRDQ